MKLFKHLLALMLTLACWQVVHAEGNCPEGYFPVGGGGPGSVQGCIPMQDADQGNAPKPPRWEAGSRWGAIATDEPHGILGASTDLPSRELAIRAAMNDCAAKGSSQCKFELAYDNECVVLVASDSSYVVISDETIAIAAQSAMRRCQSNGAKNCGVYYSACSLPRRIQ